MLAPFPDLRIHEAPGGTVRTAGLLLLKWCGARDFRYRIS
jgi:hypothetical protein